MEKKKISSKIHLLIFEEKKDLASTFVRFQEYYESPEFKGKIFSLDEFKEWYTKNSPKGKETGEFTYYSDWGGFNIPSYALEPFHGGKFNPLTSQEKMILELFNKEEEPFYVVGVYKKSKDLKGYLVHETAHGLFYTDSDYKREILDTLSNFDLESIKKELSQRGYGQEVLDDEVHAYTLGGKEDLKSNFPEEMYLQIKEVYDKYSRINGVNFDF